MPPLVVIPSMLVRGFGGFEPLRVVNALLGAELARLRGVDFADPSDQSQSALVGLFRWLGGHGGHSWRWPDPEPVAVVAFRLEEFCVLLFTFVI